MSFILASTSPFRRQLLESAGLVFDIDAPRVDEAEVEARLREGRPALPPEDLVRALAEAKAREVSRRHPGRVVVGADQLLALDDEVLGKPPDAAEATRRLRQLAGRTHRLMTAVAVVGGEEPDTVFIEETDLTLRALTDEEVAKYVETGEWRGCAGGYRIEGQGIRLMSRVEGDYHNVIGLPLLAVLRALRERGLA